MSEIRISAKDLGAMALDDFCPRCFWLKRKAKKIPFQIFPGIFSSIDAYTKKVVHAIIDDTNSAPAWMPNFDQIVGYLKVPHWSKYLYRDPVTGLVLSGVPDDILVRKDETHVIPDYKTAKYTETQDKLRPMYDVQLNAYAIINEEYLGIKVSDLFIGYCEPVTDEETAKENYFSSGFDMRFQAKAVSVERNGKRVFELLAQAKDILESPIPAGVDGCKDCASLEQLQGLMAA